MIIYKIEKTKYTSILKLAKHLEWDKVYSKVKFFERPKIRKSDLEYHNIMSCIFEILEYLDYEILGHLPMAWISSM